MYKAIILFPDGKFSFIYRTANLDSEKVEAETKEDIEFLLSQDWKSFLYFRSEDETFVPFKPGYLPAPIVLGAVLEVSA